MGHGEKLLSALTRMIAAREAREPGFAAQVEYEYALLKLQAAHFEHGAGSGVVHEAEKRLDHAQMALPPLDLSKTPEI